MAEGKRFSNVLQAESAGTVKYGVCFVDTSIGTFHVSMFS